MFHVHPQSTPSTPPCLSAIQADHSCFVASATTTSSERAGPCGIALLWGIESGRNLARHPLDSRPLSRSPPRLLLFPHRRATPGADVIEDFLVEQHQEKALSHWHGTFAGRAEEQARLQVFKILLLLRRRHRNRHPSSFSCLSHHHFAQVLAQHQRRKRPDDTRVRLTVPGVPAGELHPPQDDCGFGHQLDGRLKIPQKIRFCAV